MHNTDITRDSVINPLDTALGLNSSRTSASRFPDHRDLIPDVHNQMATDDSVYTVNSASPAIYSPAQYNRLNESHPNPLSGVNNSRQYPVTILGTSARVQNDSSEIVNQTVQPTTPPPIYQDVITGAKVTSV